MADYREMMDKMRREGQMERERVHRPTEGQPGPKSFAKVSEPGSYGFGAGMYKGSGGYEYKVDTDGTITIAKSPRSAGGQKILPGTQVHEKIMDDIQRSVDMEKRLADLEAPAKTMVFEEEYIEGTLPSAKK